MSNFLFKDRDGQTPLPPELLKGLRHPHIQNMGELDEYEEANIAQGLAWLAKTETDHLDSVFWQRLHTKLFGDVWSWAGEIRTHELANPYFLEPRDIRAGLKKLEDDLKYWLDKKEIPFQEIAARFHERLLTIHPFANGNGRFARIIVEHFCRPQKEIIPTWGNILKDDPQGRRKSYVAALDHSRQKKDYAPLIQFMFS